MNLKKIFDNFKKWLKHYFRKENRQKAIITVLAIAIVIVAAGYYFYKQNLNQDGKLDLSVFKFWQAGDKKVAEDAVKYINDNQLASSEVTLVKVSRESGVIKIKIKIGSTEFDSYVTKDGKYLFPSALEMIKGEEENKNNEVSSASSCEDLTKSDSPMLDVYVVSQCPYGIQMQRAMADAVSRVPELANYIKARYIGSIEEGKITSMHGDEEAQENLRQICIREEQSQRYWNYVSCYIKAGKSTSCLATSGIDQSALSSCMTNGKGLSYAKEDFDLTETYSISGSPTLILGDKDINESSFGGRSSDAIKKIVCCASSAEPSFCSQTLNTDSAASSYSETYEGTKTSNSASCE